LTWIDGWTGGLVLGTVIALALEASARAAIYWFRHRKHAHCLACDGCLARDGRAIAAIEKLAVCRYCGDTYPSQFAPKDFPAEFPTKPNGFNAATEKVSTETIERAEREIARRKGG
jgi:hypothetical protein